VIGTLGLAVVVALAFRSRRGAETETVTLEGTDVEAAAT